MLRTNLQYEIRFRAVNIKRDLEIISFSLDNSYFNENRLYGAKLRPILLYANNPRVSPLGELLNCIFIFMVTMCKHMFLFIDVILDTCIITKMYKVLDIHCNYTIIFYKSSPALNIHVLFQLDKLFHRVFDFNSCTV